MILLIREDLLSFICSFLDEPAVRRWRLRIVIKVIEVHNARLTQFFRSGFYKLEHSKARSWQNGRLLMYVGGRHPTIIDWLRMIMILNRLIILFQSDHFLLTLLHIGCIIFYNIHCCFYIQIGIRRFSSLITAIHTGSTFQFHTFKFVKNGPDIVFLIRQRSCIMIKWWLLFLWMFNLNAY